MDRLKVACILAAMLLLAPGCEKKATRFVGAPVSAETLEPGVAPGGGADKASAGLLAAEVSPLRRYIAERHELALVTPESELPKSWQAAIAACNTLHCEILASKLTTRADDALPSGSISARVVPQDLPQLLAEMQKLAKVAQDTTTRDDKTTEVVDTDAKIRNLTTFRDNLRSMLARSSATVQDLIEIQRQLADTQSDLDGVVGNRKVLANETEKVAVDITFQVEEVRRNRSAFAAIREALRESGMVLGESTASLITTFVAIVPWLLLFALAIWILVKLGRRIRRRPKAAGQSSASKA